MHDHRKLGRELGLFDTDPLIGAGLPYWLPAGAAVPQRPYYALYFETPYLNHRGDARFLAVTPSTRLAAPLIIRTG